MSILDKVQSYHTGRRVPEPVEVTLESANLGPVNCSQMLFSSEHVVELKVKATFLANPANYHVILKDAKRQLLHALYAEVLADLDKASHQLMYGRRDKAFAEIQEIRRKLTEVV